jgi:hypothetical protein
MSKQIMKWLQEYVYDTEKEAAVLPMAEIELRVKGIKESFESETVDQMNEAMTTAHFSYYFADALSRKFLKDYAYQQGSWRNYTFADTAPDFRDVDRFRMSEPGTLRLRREKAEMKAGEVHDSEVHYGVEEYSEQFDISWRTIQNDDLGKLRQTPLKMAQAAARFEDAFVSALYDNAVTQATLAGLGAPWSGTGRLTAANLAIGINAMKQRPAVAGGDLVQINRIHLVIPPVLEIQANTILESVLMAGVATNDKNVLGRYIAGVWTDPYIAFTAPNIPWYLFADPNEVETVPVARLQGFDAPWTFMKMSDMRLVSGSAPSPFMMGSFATGDIEYGVETIIGGWDDASYVGVINPVGIYYSSGTTP